MSLIALVAGDALLVATLFGLRRVLRGVARRRDAGQARKRAEAVARARRLALDARIVDARVAELTELVVEQALERMADGAGPHGGHVPW